MSGPLGGVPVEGLVRNKAFVWERPLRRADLEALGELVVEAWLERAPKRVAQAFLDEHPRL